MAIDLHAFWDTNNPKNPPLTDEMLRTAEKLLDVQLPPLLVALLRLQNGGSTNTFDFPMPQAPWRENRVRMHELFGIVTDEGLKSNLNILDTAYMTEEWDLPERQVLLWGEGHWWVTLDYRTSTEPTVLWIDADDAVEMLIAPSFEAFYNGLVPAAPMEG
ncbi:SMI1/KNR4 family protein [Hymenobacter lapidiphilus]|uniref:SMI1/KNR4 family protein n=1 Tax=Hymenobacter sp. CCM 8763 TaxID=2303334 RepID=UPI000E357057|nr:SMI1/KNR4 family protein [Hymenobacter sp. CCM 8763]RFP66441.1 SMI1/KNR4 family protein [Hymenobacter sp. CCM 8763]